MSLKELLGAISILFAFVGNGAYFVSALRNRTKPHVFSWTAWGLMTAITFFAQNSAEAGAGSWHIAANSFCCFAVAILAFTKGNHDITKPDLIAFVCCLSAMPMWYLTKEPLFAIIIVIIVEGFAYYPTFRKAFFKPREEMASAYTIDSLRAALSVPALQVYSFTTVVYPLFVIFVNLALISMIAVRRQRLVPPLPFD